MFCHGGPSKRIIAPAASQKGTHAPAGIHEQKEDHGEVS
jgi:hypothetical protein